MSRNYAETLAYWYLRLNGFIPMTNFVLHRPYGEHDNGIRRSADADILAVRFPFAYEIVGGQPGYTSDEPPGDWDGVFRDSWHFDFRREIIGLIVEIKSGDVDRADVCRAFSSERVVYGLQRLGMLDMVQYQNFATTLCYERVRCGRQYHAHGDHVARQEMPDGSFRCVGKLLVSSEPLESDSWFNLTLENALTFINQRFTKYMGDKEPDRYYFPDDLIQFLAWRAANL